jgi:hypothetical protein
MFLEQKQKAPLPMQNTSTNLRTPHAKHRFSSSSYSSYSDNNFVTS